MFFRFLELGDRLTTTTNEMKRVVGGLDGQLGARLDLGRRGHLERTDLAPRS
jgi:hypothetical protein